MPFGSQRARVAVCNPRRVADPELAEWEVLDFEDDRDKCTQHLLTFTENAWHTIEPNTTFLPNWHITLISEYLMAVSLGWIKRLALNIPPRYMKSTLVSIMWPCWEWVSLNPAESFVFSSYSASLSSYHSIKRRDVLTSEWYQKRWGDKVQIRPDHNRQADYMNSEMGMMFSTSVGGSVTGMGGNKLVIDDPTNPREAISDAVREQANDWYYNTYQNRLNDKRNGAIVLIQQRLHMRDMTGFVTEIDLSDLTSHVLHNNGWTLVRIPLISEQDEEILSPLDGRLIKYRKEGELLWTEREGPEQIREVQKDEFVFASQQQQRPSSRKGSIFERSWFDDHMYDKLPVRPDTYIMSVDANFKGGKKSDYVVIQVWAWKRPNAYLEYEIRKRIGFTKTVEEILGVLGRYPDISAKVIEEAANGFAIIDSLQNEVGGMVAWDPTDSKEARARAVTPYFRSGNVWVKKADWTRVYISEMINFPGVANDDQVDATSQAIDYLWRTFGNLGAAHQTAVARIVHTGR